MQIPLKDTQSDHRQGCVSGHAARIAVHATRGNLGVDQTASDANMGQFVDVVINPTGRIVDSPSYARNSRDKTDNEGPQQERNALTGPEQSKTPCGPSWRVRARSLLVGFGDGGSNRVLKGEMAHDFSDLGVEVFYALVPSEPKPPTSMTARQKI